MQNFMSNITHTGDKTGGHFGLTLLIISTLCNQKLYCTFLKPECNTLMQVDLENMYLGNDQEVEHSVSQRLSTTESSIKITCGSNSVPDDIVQPKVACSWSAECFSECRS